MVTVSPLAQAKNGPRPMNPLRDWHGVAQLMRLAFQSDVSLTSLPLLPDWRWLRWLDGLLLGASGLLGGDVADQLHGYVWSENGVIVGNATLGLNGHQNRIWLLSNVAVHPDYRRRGIARTLVEMAAEEARRLGGEYLTLQVERDNAGARRLYEQLGFRHIEQVSKLGNVLSRAQQAATHQFRIGPPTRTQWAQVRALAGAHLPESLARFHFTHAQMFAAPYRFSWWQGLWQRLEGVQCVMGCVSDVASGAVAGGFFMRSQGHWGPRQLALVIAEAYRGAIEEELLAYITQTLGNVHGGRVTVFAPTTHGDLLRKLAELGLHELRVLDLMALPLRS